MEDFKKNTKKKIENKIKKLIFKINYHDDLYYNYNTQEISDYEYDILRKELETIEKEHPSLKLHSSPSFKVGSKSTKEKKVLDTKRQCCLYFRTPRAIIFEYLYPAMHRDVFPRVEVSRH